MLLNKLKQFHQQTMERYRDEENMEPWKKAVMEIHEKATFLFYYDATLEQNSRTATLRSQGTLVYNDTACFGYVRVEVHSALAVFYF